MDPSGALSSVSFARESFDALRLERLSQVGFRNLNPGPLEFASRLNVISGDNGHGKTSLIEAIYLLCTTKSFRTSNLGEVIQVGSETTQLRGLFSKGGIQSTQEAALSARGRSFLLDGKSPRPRLRYAQDKPVVAFHPGDRELASGPGTPRRRLLDRVLLYLDAAGAEARLRYQEASTKRMELLLRGARPAELLAYEEVVARFGAELCRARERTAGEVLRELQKAFELMGAPGLELRAEFVPGGSTDMAIFIEELAARRAQDVRRKSPSFGPQKDELALSLEGRAVRSHASQGQQRLVALSLKWAELAVIRNATRLDPLLLLDDVSSELDGERTAAVFRFLAESESQVFVTTTRPELFENLGTIGASRRDFRLFSGRALGIEQAPFPGPRQRD